MGILPSGKVVLLGTEGAVLTDLPKGTQVIPHNETKKILSYTGDIDGEYVKQYKDGTKKYPSADELIRELRANDNFLFHYPGYDGSPVVAMNGDVYIEQRDGSYAYSREVWNDTRRDEKLRLLYGDMLKVKYPDSEQYKEYQNIEKYIQSRHGGSSQTSRNQALGSYYMGGSQDKNLPSDFKSYRENRATNMEQIQADQQKIIDDIAKGLDISQLREDLLKRIDEQLQEDVRMQFRLQDDLLKQQQENSKKFMNELEKEYLDAIGDGNIDKAQQLAEKYNEASDIYLQTSEKVKNSIKERYDYEFSLIDKKLNKQNQVMNELEYQKNLIETLNPDNIIGISDIYKEMADHTSDQITYLYEILNQLSEQQSLLEVGSYEWNIINGQVDNVVSKIRSANLEMAKMAKSAFSGFANKFKDDVLDINPETTSPDKAEDDSDKWLEGLEKQLEIQKLMKYVEENKLELNEKQLAIINSQGKIRKKELDVVRKQLELQQLLVKIENLRNQKTIQQLTKRDDGTWDFEYVADLDAISELEDQILDKKLEGIYAEKALRKELQEEAEREQEKAIKAAQDRYQKQIEKFEEVLKNAEQRTYKSAEEFRAALESTGLEFAEGWLDEAVDEYWKYFTTTAEIFINEALDRTKQALKDQSKAFESIGNESGKSYADGLLASIDEIMSGEGDIVQKQQAIIDMLASEYSEFALAGNKNGMSFINGLISSMETVDYQYSANEMSGKIVQAMEERLKELEGTGQNAGKALLEGLLASMEDIANNGEIEDKLLAMLDLLDKTDEYGTLGQALGKEFMQGLTDTIVEISDEVSGEGEGVLSEALNTMLEMLDGKLVDFAEKGDIQGVAYAEALRTRLVEALENAELTQNDIINLLAEFKDFDLAGLLSGEAYGDSLTEGLIGAEKDVDEKSSEIVDGLNKDVENFGDAGKKQGEAYKESITSAFQDAINTAKSIVGSLVDYINSSKFNVDVSVGDDVPELKGYSTGIEQGLITKDHLAMLHGDKTNWEGVFTKDQLDKLLKSAVLSTVNVVTPKVPNVALAGVGSSGDQVFNISKLEFPNVRDANEIEKAIKNLPNKFKQKIR